MLRNQMGNIFFYPRLVDFLDQQVGMIQKSIVDQKSQACQQSVSWDFSTLFQLVGGNAARSLCLHVEHNSGGVLKPKAKISSIPSSEGSEKEALRLEFKNFARSGLWYVLRNRRCCCTKVRNIGLP